MLKTLLNFLSGGIISEVGSQLNEAYSNKLKAQTNEQKLEADMTIAQLEARQNVLIAETRRGMTAWIRPALAAPVVIYVWKLLVWDTVLQLGTTPDPGQYVHWITTTIVGAYMLTRPFERR